MSSQGKMKDYKLKQEKARQAMEPREQEDFKSNPLPNRANRRRQAGEKNRKTWQEANRQWQALNAQTQRTNRNEEKKRLKAERKARRAELKEAKRNEMSQLPA